MPGITGIIGNQANLATLQKMREKVNYFSYITESYNMQDVSLARIHCGYVNRQPQPVFSADKRYVCVMIGEIFGIDGLTDEHIDHEAQLLLDRFVTEGISLLPKVNGQYSACIFDSLEKTACLISDRYGSRPVYYTIVGDSLYFAPETKALLAAGNHPVINYVAFSDMFHFGHLAGNKTMFEGVEQLPAASVLIFKQGRARIESYWDYPFDEASYSEEKQPSAKYKEQKEHLKSVMKKAVERQVRKNRDKFLIPLSGGLDSRFMAALTRELCSESINSFTLGGSKSEEQQYGAQIARILEFSHRALDTYPDDFWESASLSSYVSDGMSLIYQPALFNPPCVNYHHSAEIILVPQMCDALFGSMLTRKYVRELRKNPERERADTILTNFYNLMDEECLQLIFEKEFYQKYIREHWKITPKMYIDRYRHPLHSYFMQLHQEHVRKGVLSANLIYNLYFDTRMPSYDNDLIDLAFHIPLPFKINQNIYRFAFAEMFPELAKIKREGTHLPIDAPDWMINMLRLRDKFLIKSIKIPFIEKHTKRFIPPTYYNYDQWFRFDLRERLHSFLNEKKIMDRGIFNKDGVETILRLHDKPTEDYSRLLWQIVNLEYFFRNFVD